MQQPNASWVPGAPAGRREGSAAVWGGQTSMPVPGGARAVPCLAAGPVLCWQQGWGLSLAPLACPCPAQPCSVLQSLAGRAEVGWQRPALGSTPLHR